MLHDAVVLVEGCGEEPPADACVILRKCLRAACVMANRGGDRDGRVGTVWQPTEILLSPARSTRKMQPS